MTFVELTMPEGSMLVNPFAVRSATPVTDGQGKTLHYLLEFIDANNLKVDNQRDMDMIYKYAAMFTHTRTSGKTVMTSQGSFHSVNVNIIQNYESVESKSGNIRLVIITFNGGEKRIFDSEYDINVLQDWIRAQNVIVK
jgi:hypothetical protein